MAEPSADSQTHAGHAHSGMSKGMKWLLGGTALAAGAVIVSPYVLPMLGASSPDLAIESMNALHTAAGAGSGLAGALNSMLGAVPLIGETLAKGGIATAVASGVTGIGGVLLGRYMEKREDGKKSIKWGKVVTVAALTTSALIALPTALTGISIGLTYLAALQSTELATSAVKFLSGTIGAANGENLIATGLSSAAVATAHLLTCGVAALPAVISFGIHGSKKPDDEHAQHVMPPAPALATGVNAAITLAEPTQAGREAKGIITLTDANGMPIQPQELKTVHTKKLHFFAIDSSLRDYHHIHPTPTDVPGQYAFSFTPKTNNNYSGWTDITLQRDAQNYRLKAEMAAENARSIPPSILVNSRAEAKNAGLTFEWKADKPLTKNASSMVEVTVKDAQGKPVTDLEPVLGAYAHLVGFTADGNTLIHSHPMGSEPLDATSRSGPTLRFHVTPESAGNSQFYLQVKEHGQDIYAPFGQMVKQPGKATEQLQPRSLYATAPAMQYAGRA